LLFFFTVKSIPHSLCDPIKPFVPHKVLRKLHSLDVDVQIPSNHPEEVNTAAMEGKRVEEGIPARIKGIMLIGRGDGTHFLAGVSSEIVLIRI
jgi:hypothetical protein